MSSASLRPGEKRAIRGAGTCASTGTATASARKPAAKLSPASKRKRNSPRCGIAGDSNRGFRSFTFLWEDIRMSKKQKGTMTSRRTITFFSIIFVGLFVALLGWLRVAATQQDQPAQKKQQVPTIEEYQPKSTLVTKEHKIERAKFPFIDIHSHHWNPTPEEVD